MRKDGRLREAIDMFELAGKSPSYLLKAQAQIGLCHRAMGDHGAAIQAFRAALSDQSALSEWRLSMSSIFSHGPSNRLGR